MFPVLKMQISYFISSQCLFVEQQESKTTAGPKSMQYFACCGSPHVSLEARKSVLCLKMRPMVCVCGGGGRSYFSFCFICFCVYSYHASHLVSCFDCSQYVYFCMIFYIYQCVRELFFKPLLLRSPHNA